MITIAKPLIGDEEINAVVEVMRSGVIAEGKVVAEFEAAFAEFTGTRYAVAVNSGTAALHCALLASGVGTGDEVITTPFTFIATANSILHAGARPVFADICEDTFNIDVDSVAQKITNRTKAIMPVHLYGHPADMKPLCELAEEHDLQIIEDACQAHGAEYHGKKVGSFKVGCFSFYPTKNMTTGEGGIITTDDEEIAERARVIRNHGSNRRYYHDVLGYNLRMTNISAAVGLEQLKKLPDFNKRRQSNAKLLTEKISSFVRTPVVQKHCTHVFHQYTIRVDSGKRDSVVESLLQKGVGANIYYPVPVHRQELYRRLGYRERLPVAEKASTEVLSLPIHPSVTKEELEYMALTLEEVLR
jgi:dTDP-4-amino-4,6-dideoxygalactose transaminase